MRKADLSCSPFTRPARSSPRKEWRHLAVLFTLFALALVLQAEASIVVPLTEEALIEDAAAIVIGHVTSIRGNYDQNRGIIFTNVAVAIEDVLKGEIPVGEITLRQVGGSFGDLHSWVVGSPQFTLGERALLFLRVDRGGNLRVAHLYQGKFTVSFDLASGEEYATREMPPGVYALRGSSSGASLELGQKETHRLRDLTDRIRNHLQIGTDQPSQQRVPLTLTPEDTTGITPGALQENFTFLGPARWFEPDSNTAVSMKINAAGEPLAPTNGFDQIRQSFQAWSSVSGSSFWYQDGGFTNGVGFQHDGINAVSFRDPLGQMDPPVNCSGILAIGGFSLSDSSQTRTVNGTTFNRILEGDLVFNDGWAGCGFYENFSNFAEVATHELGHVLGLGHSSNPDATMYYLAHFDGRGASLRQDDIDGLRAIYPGPVATLIANPASPQFVGTAITFTASATGGVTPYQYKWWLYNGTGWSLLQDWSASATFTWTPTLPNPNYWVGVWVRSAGTPGDDRKATRSIPFAITVPPPPGSVTLTPDHTAPQVTGTAITFTASASGGVTPYQYKWWLYNGTGWSLVRDWAASNTFTWTPTLPNASYWVGVWVRSAGTSAEDPKATRSIPFAITAPSAQVRFLNNLCINNASGCVAFSARLTAQEGYTWYSTSGEYSSYQSVTSSTLSNF